MTTVRTHCIRQYHQIDSIVARETVTLIYVGINVHEIQICSEGEVRYGGKNISLKVSDLLLC